MSRQRTINDQGFWHSPLLQSCTTEDKLALLHLLTSPESNIIGVYPVVPHIASTEIGLTQEQWLQAMERLRSLDLVWYDTERMVVWVKIWWEHYPANKSMVLKLRNWTVNDIRKMPVSWREAFLLDFRRRLSIKQLTILNAALHGDL